MRLLPTRTLRASLVILTCSVVFASAQREKSVVLPPDEARNWHPWGSEVHPQTWQPTPREIDEMESHFEDLKRSKLPQHAGCWGQTFVFEPDTYYMQYSPLVFEGRQYIYINAFRNRTGPRGWEEVWHEQLIWPPKGGGTNYWRVLYEPATKNFSGS